MEMKLATTVHRSISPLPAKPREKNDFLNIEESENCSPLPDSHLKEEMKTIGLENFTIPNFLNGVISSGIPTVADRMIDIQRGTNRSRNFTRVCKESLKLHVFIHVI